MILLAVWPLGCSSLEMSSLLKRSRFVEAGPNNPVVDVVCLWEPAEGRGLDNLPTRGFAVQMLFLTRGNPEPAQVNGTLRVYVFDDQGTLEEQSKPLHQFDIEGEALQKYLTETNFGPAYQLFIPYTRKGTHEARCGLRVKYTPSGGGPPVYSKMAEITLPGAKSELAAQRWNPEHRRVRPDEQLRSAASLTADRPQDVALNGGSEEPRPAAASSASKAETIPLRNSAHATQARARLQKLSAQLAAPNPDQPIQPAVYEVEAPTESAPPRFRLQRDLP